MRSLFITLEGVEGSGKTTMCEVIKDHLSAKGLDVALTREPGGTNFGEKLREILLNSDEKINPTAELLMMYAARSQHVNEKIKPLLAAGTSVICDRFSMSSHAYQGAGRGLDLKIIEDLDRITLGEFRPTVTFLFDVDVKTGMERVIARGKRDRFEQEDLAFFEKIRQGFLDYAKNHDGVVTFDSSKDLASLKNDVIAELDKLLMTMA